MPVDAPVMLLCQLAGRQWFTEPLSGNRRLKSVERLLGSKVAPVFENGSARVTVWIVYTVIHLDASGCSAVSLDDRGTPFRRRGAASLQRAKRPFHIAGKAQTFDRAHFLKARKANGEALRFGVSARNLPLLALPVFGFPLRLIKLFYHNRARVSIARPEQASAPTATSPERGSPQRAIATGDRPARIDTRQIPAFAICA